MAALALLVVAALFGGMLFYSFGFAPFLFRTLKPETAGKLLRRAFPVYYLLTIVAAALGMLLVWLAGDGLSAVLLGLTALGAVAARQGLMPAINTARDAGDASAGRFKALHGASVAINMVQLALVAWVLARFV